MLSPMCLRVSYSVPLVPGADQVVGESLDGCCCVTGLLGLTVVAEEDSLFRLGDAKT